MIIINELHFQIEVLKLR